MMLEDALTKAWKASQAAFRLSQTAFAIGDRSAHEAAQQDFEAQTEIYRVLSVCKGTA